MGGGIYNIKEVILTFFCSIIGTVVIKGVLFMAMTILNNAAANMTLGELNKNITKVGKDLKKVSTGQKINSAGDNASDFGISETMRAQIKALQQDIQNVQNGSSMLKTAHGGVENIVEELRSLKELAIDAANDSNSDEDRATLQKEFDQRRANIDQIAQWTNYNGKALLDGTYSRVWKLNGMIVPDQVATYDMNRWTTIEGSSGIVGTSGKLVSNLVGNFSAAYNTSVGYSWKPDSRLKKRD